MAVISFADDMFQMATAYATKDYSAIRRQVMENDATLDGRVIDGDEVYGFRIFDNQVLTELYGFPVKVVRFEMSQIDTLHMEHQEIALKSLFRQLEAKMKEDRAYYNLRLPAYLMDAVKVYQEIRLPSIFCGGTVALTSTNKKVDADALITCNVKEVGQEYLDAHYDELMQLTKQSFKTYQGQYHISPKTVSKAGIVYENWIESNLKSLNGNRMIAAEADGHTVGFGLVTQKGTVTEFDLSAVSSKYRGLGIYRSIAARILKMAYEDGHVMISSTQLDNYASQNTWISIGMRPYFTFYNIHYDLC